MRALFFSDAMSQDADGFITMFRVYHSRARYSINETQRRTRRIAGVGKTVTERGWSTRQKLRLLAQADSPRVVKAAWRKHAKTGNDKS